MLSVLHPATRRQRVRGRIGLATYEAGSYEQLHWHPIEAYYFVIAGHATVRDIEGREFPVGPGCSIYAPPGIAGGVRENTDGGLCPPGRSR